MVTGESRGRLEADVHKDFPLHHSFRRLDIICAIIYLCSERQARKKAALHCLSRRCREAIYVAKYHRLISFLQFRRLEEVQSVLAVGSVEALLLVGRWPASRILLQNFWGDAEWGLTCEIGAQHDLVPRCFAWGLRLHNTAAEIWISSVAGLQNRTLACQPSFPELPWLFEKNMWIYPASSISGVILGMPVPRPWTVFWRYALAPSKQLYD